MLFLFSVLRMLTNNLTTEIAAASFWKLQKYDSLHKRCLQFTFYKPCCKENLSADND